MQASADRGARPLRILLAAILFHPVYAGPAVRFRRYLPGLLARGAEVRVITATPDSIKGPASGIENWWSGIPNGAWLPEEELDGVPLHRVRLPDDVGPRRNLLFYRAIADFCRHTQHRPDVVQLFSAGPLALPVLWRLKRLGIPVVSTLTMMPKPPRNPVKRSLASTGLRWPSRLVSRFIVSSGVVSTAVRELGIRTPIDVIPNGVDTDRFRPADPRERAAILTRLGLPPQAKVLLFAGPVAPRKRVDLLLEAWCRLAPGDPDLHLFVVGPRLDTARPAWAEFNSRIESLADQSGARDRLHFTGLVDNVEDYMRAADIFVFTSAREGMGNVVLEAMASGLPVITTPFSGLPREFGEPGGEFVLSDFDPERIAADVSALLRDHRRRHELGGRARRWTVEHLGLERIVEDYSRLYHDVAQTYGRNQQRQRGHN